MNHNIWLNLKLWNFLYSKPRSNKFTRTKAQKQLKLRENKLKVREKCPRQFSNVKVRVLWRNWLIYEITRGAREYIKNTKRKEEDKNCHLKFKNGRDFLHPCWEVWAPDVAGSLWCVLCTTLSSQWLSPPKRMSGHRRIVREAWGKAGGENRRWSGIPSRGEQ